MRAFEVLSWPALTFIVPVVGLLWFTAMARTLKAMTDFAAHRVFQLTYAYEARKPGIKEQITEMTFNGAGVRDTARTLKIGSNFGQLHVTNATELPKQLSASVLTYGWVFSLIQHYCFALVHVSVLMGEQAVVLLCQYLFSSFHCWL